MADELVGDPLHNRERESTLDPGMGLPLSNAGMDAISSTQGVEELKRYTVKGAKY